MTDNVKNRIFALLKQMNSAKILQKNLYEEIQYWLSNKNDDEFQEKQVELERNCDILTKYYKHCLKQRRTNQFNAKELAQHSKTLLEFLRACRDDMKHYSIENVLIKVELMLLDVVDDQSKVNENSSPNPIFMNIYSTKKDMTNVDDEKLYLLNELMDAPLDDIIIYMQKRGWPFERFYTNEFYSQLLSRLEHQKTSSDSSKNIINQLSNYITKKLMGKYRLYGMEFISLLADQFYNITPNKYRILLEEFVKNNLESDWTLKKFYSFHKLPSVFSPDNNRKFASLFKIYCIKLHDTNPSSRNNYNTSYQQIKPVLYPPSFSPRQSKNYNNYIPYQSQIIEYWRQQPMNGQRRPRLQPCH